MALRIGTSRAARCFLMTDRRRTYPNMTIPNGSGRRGGMAEEMQPKGMIGAGADSYLVAEEADAVTEDLLPGKPVDAARAKAEADLEALRDEIFALREHVADR